MAEPRTSEALDHVCRRFEAAFNAGDVGALANLYEPGAVLMPAPGEIVKGREQIRSAFEQILAGKPVIRMETVACVEGPGGIALTQSKWTMTVQDAEGYPAERAAISAEVLRRQPDGRWLYIIDNPFAG